MKTIAITIAAISLTACAYSTGGNSRSVTIQAGAAMAGKAQAEADAHCAKYDRVAVLSSMVGMNQRNYDCVAK